MNVGAYVRSFLIIFISTWTIKPLRAEPLSLALSPSGSQLQLSWPAAITNGNQAAMFPEYELQYSRDLNLWTPLSGKMRGLDGRSGPLLSRSVASERGPIFYRVRADLDPGAPGPTADGGTEVFGYNDRFASALQTLGQLALEDFATNGADIAYLSRLSWDPTTAQFWPQFAPGNVASTLRLNSNEAALFLTNGFVVSERLGNSTFGDAYYGLFNADVPVFVTADSVLHAWHRTYQSVMEELEELQLSTLLAGIISNMSLQLPATWQQYGQGPLKDCILDADHFLTVARSLWVGQQVPSTLGNAGVNQQVGNVLMAIDGQGLREMPLFGSNRVIDFSQFKVRGHYDASDRLRH